MKAADRESIAQASRALEAISRQLRRHDYDVDEVLLDIIIVKLEWLLTGMRELQAARVSEQ